ncbi:MAG: hypothetical protein HRJ53_02405 [Acidobacteria bacterium Pan2503]|uniref:Uncharacterized protein n=1 Tax=Candidatus Acidiferrum panamense TaxID=2741543 RepID=A0A7V8NM33_9BACT|nr:hypothetical protein [Candidatus Acidoferrum panamensis]
MLQNWKWSHTVIVILTFAVAGLGALAAKMPDTTAWAGPLATVLTVVLGLFGVTSPSARGGAAVVLLLGLASSNSACAAAKPIVQGVIDIAEAVCTQAEQQPEPQWVYFVCTVPGAVAPIVATYTLRVPATEARSFALVHAPKAAP